MLIELTSGYLNVNSYNAQLTQSKAYVNHRSQHLPAFLPSPCPTFSKAYFNSSAADEKFSYFIHKVVKGALNVTRVS